MAPYSSTLAWKIPVDRGAWRATVHRVTQSRRWPKRLSTHLCSQGGCCYCSWWEGVGSWGRRSVTQCQGHQVPQRTVQSPKSLSCSQPPPQPHFCSPIPSRKVKIPPCSACGESIPRRMKGTSLGNSPSLKALGCKPPPLLKVTKTESIG